jgi:hypothetical protein
VSFQIRIVSVTLEKTQQLTPYTLNAMGRVLFERQWLGRAYKGLFLRPESGSVSVTQEKTQQLTPYTLNAMGRVLFERQWLGRAVHRTLGAPVLTSSPGCSASISLTCSHPAFVTLRMSLQLRYDSTQQHTAKNQYRKFVTNIPRKGKGLRGHSPNFHIRVSVSDFYISTIDLPILLQEICEPILGI